MDRYCKRLIEVDLPIRRISAHAKREKNLRHGHISTMHIWWARRPLAACRSVVCAALWPDPVQENFPESFREAARSEMRKWTRNNPKLISKDSWKRFLAIQKDPLRLNDNDQLRDCLLDFIADFANWDNAAVPQYMETSAVLTRAAHESLGGESGTKPLVVDPFAGGGAIPLEALRVGADAYAADLNPVAVLLNKVILQYIPRYGNELAEAVEKWAQWIKEKAEEELAEFYPRDPDGTTPITYLWARTVNCEGPGCGMEIPLLRSLWLSNKKNVKSVKVALRLVPNRGERRIDFQIIENAKASEIGSGTSAGGAATCPSCGFTTVVESVREQLSSRNGGAADARLVAVVTVRHQKRGQLYRLPTSVDYEATSAAAKELERRKTETSDKAMSLIPDEPITHIRGFINIILYGITEWGDLFSPRQALALETYSRLVRTIPHSTGDPDFDEAVRTCLATLVDRVAVRCTSELHLGCHDWLRYAAFQSRSIAPCALGIC